MILKTQGIIIFLACLECVEIISAAVPANRSIEQSTNQPLSSTGTSKNSSVCWTDNVAYNDQDIVPGAGPCEQCICNTTNIVCSMIKCEVKTGCKIIQKPNQCCPDYKCDCEYNGQTYNNGAKIDTPDTPCRVCYCKGGDVMCTTVGCYEREDCEGKIVPGTCCPKYDHCPSLDADNPKNRIKSTTTNTVTIRNGKHGSQPWLLTTDSAYTADPLSELTTIAEEGDYTTEVNFLPDKMITMVLQRFNSSETQSSLQTTLPPSTDSTIEPQTTNNLTASPESPGVSAASEAINTVSVSTLSINRTASTTSDIIEARMEPTTGVMDDESNESNETNTLNANTETSTSFITASVPETTNTESLKLSTNTEAVTVLETVVHNSSELQLNEKLIEGTVVNIQTIVKQIDSHTNTMAQDIENTEIIFVEKDSNLSALLSPDTITSMITSNDDNLTTSVSSTTTIESNTTSSPDDESTTSLSEMEIGLHKNLSLFVDIGRLNTTEFIDFTTISEVETTPQPKNETADANQNLTVQNVSQFTAVPTETSTLFLNTSEAEVFMMPITNASHENETSSENSTMPSSTVASLYRAVEPLNTNMTQAFSYPYSQLSIALNSVNNTECAFGSTNRTQELYNTSPMYNESSIATTKTLPLTNSINPVTMTESTMITSTVEQKKANLTSAWTTSNISVTTVSSQPSCSEYERNTDKMLSNLTTPTPANLSSTVSPTTDPKTLTTTVESNSTTSSPINSTQITNKTTDEKIYEELMSQTYIMQPVKIINTVHSVYLSAGLGYRESSQNRSTTAANVTTPIPHSNMSKTNDMKTNSSPAYKILLDGKVKPITRPPNSTMAPLSWLKGPIPSNIVQLLDSTTRAAIISNSTTSPAIPSTNSTKSNVTAETNESLKNESRQEPAQAKVYDPLMPYPEEYPEEYQTIQNGPAIIITRTTYTRIPDVTYTTVTMATLPTYAQVQKAEENFASTLFERKFGERSYERTDSSSNADEPSPDRPYFNIDVKKIEPKLSNGGSGKMTKDERKMESKNDQKFVIVHSQPISREDEEEEDVHSLDEKDMKIVENFMNKNLRL